MKLAAPEQCAANVIAWLAYCGFNPGREPFLKDSDRTWFIRDAAWDATILRLRNSGLIERREAKNHGTDVVDGYRECVSRCAAQIVVHKTAIEVDFDFWQPWDVVGVIGHGIEVVRNKISKNKTDPFEVAKRLKKRGVHVVSVSL